ncbi:MAG: hypothetical protein NTV55_00505 [Planctomycetota bacterium]|nr:hypothetical protein [Planctomycetota bacterium]
MHQLLKLAKQPENKPLHLARLLLYYATPLKKRNRNPLKMLHMAPKSGNKWQNGKKGRGKLAGEVALMAAAS